MDQFINQVNYSIYEYSHWQLVGRTLAQQMYPKGHNECKSKDHCSNKGADNNSFEIGIIASGLSSVATGNESNQKGKTSEHGTTGRCYFKTFH